MKSIFLLPFLFLSACSTQQKQKPVAESAAEVVYTRVDSTTAGVISGTVLFKGKAPQRTKVDMEEDPQCARLHKQPVYQDSIAVNSKGNVGNVFVYIKHGLEGKTFQPSAASVTMVQKGCGFEPRVLGIQTGQGYQVINSDPVTHNIHPRPKNNREWNHSQAAGAEPLLRRFIQPEVMIRVKCNVHSWMKAWIGVVESPYFAVTATDGSFELKNVPPGKYTIEAWQEELGTQEQELIVEPSGKPTLLFTFKGD